MLWSGAPLTPAYCQGHAEPKETTHDVVERIALELDAVMKQPRFALPADTDGRSRYRVLYFKVASSKGYEPMAEEITKRIRRRLSQLGQPMVDDQVSRQLDGLLLDCLRDANGDPSCAMQTGKSMNVNTMAIVNLARKYESPGSARLTLSVYDVETRNELVSGMQWEIPKFLARDTELQVRAGGGLRSGAYDRQHVQITLEPEWRFDPWSSVVLRASRTFNTINQSRTPFEILHITEVNGDADGLGVSIDGRYLRAGDLYIIPSGAGFESIFDFDEEGLGIRYNRVRISEAKAGTTSFALLYRRELGARTMRYSEFRPHIEFGIGIDNTRLRAEYSISAESVSVTDYSGGAPVGWDTTVTSVGTNAGFYPESGFSGRHSWLHGQLGMGIEYKRFMFTCNWLFGMEWSKFHREKYTNLKRVSGDPLTVILQNDISTSKPYQAGIVNGDRHSIEQPRNGVNKDIFDRSQFAFTLFYRLL